MGYDHFAVNNVSYHGSNLSIVWQKPGGATYYPTAPAGYSLYVDGKRVLTAADLTHLTWDSASGAVQVSDGTGVSFHAPARLVTADQVDLSGNARIVDSFQKAGVDLTAPDGLNTDLAAGKTATASFTTTSPAAQKTDPANAVDGFTISGLPVTSGAYVGTNPIWGDLGSPNAQDWLQVDLGKPARIGDVKLYFYDNKAFGSGGNTYRAPASYTVQYFDGSNWVDVPNQAHSPAVPAPNYNDVTFTPVTTSKVRVVMNRAAGFAVGVKEIQVFNTVPEPCTTTVTGTHAGPLTATGVTCLVGATVNGPVTVRPGASLVATGSTVSGPISATGARQIALDGTTVGGPVSVTGTTGAVSIDNGSTINGPLSITGTAGGVTLAGSRVSGPVNLTTNEGTAQVVVSANTIGGPLPCTRNSPAPTNLGMPNTVGGPTVGQCAGL
jgi:hypothetical protein